MAKITEADIEAYIAEEARWKITVTREFAIKILRQRAQGIGVHCPLEAAFEERERERQAYLFSRDER